MNLPAIRHRHLLAYLIVTCALAAVGLSVVPGSSLAAVTAQTGVAGIFVVVMIALFDPVALKAVPRVGKLSCAVFVPCVCVLAIALVAGLATAAFSLLSVDHDVGDALLVSVKTLSESAATFKAPTLENIVLFIVLCLVTGVLEETLFRGVLFRGFAEFLKGAGNRHALLSAAATSAVLFGLLHVSDAVTSLPVDAVSVAQLVGKPVQASLFGFIMAAVYVRSGNIWLVVGTHAAFNILSELPTFAFNGQLVQTYLTGNPADLVVLFATIALFIPVAIASARLFEQADRPR